MTDEPTAWKTTPHADRLIGKLVADDLYARLLEKAELLADWRGDKYVRAIHVERAWALLLSDAKTAIDN